MGLKSESKDFNCNLLTGGEKKKLSCICKTGTKLVPTS